MEGTLSAVQVISGSLSPARIITGTLSSNATHITGKITSTATLVGELTEANAQIAGALIIPVQRNEDIDTYEGEYITPQASCWCRRSVRHRNLPVSPPSC